MHVNLTALRWYQQVADGVTLTEISEIDSVTQSGVSRALARLDQELGVALLRKSGRTLRMTQAGATLKRHVDAMLHEYDDGLAELSLLTSPDTGTVALAFQLSLGTWLVPNLVASFRRRSPDVRFDLHQIRDEAIASPLSQGAVDLEITTVESADASLRRRLLLAEPLCLAVPPAHPLARRDSVSLAAVATERFVLLRPGYALRRSSEALCRAAGFVPDVAFESDDLPTVQGFVAAGLGISIIPEPPRTESDSAVRTVAIADDGASREVWIAWSTNRRLLPAADLFRRHVVEQARARRL